MPSNGPLSFFQQRGSTSATQQGKTCFPQSLMLTGSGLTPSEGENCQDDHCCFQLYVLRDGYHLEIFREYFAYHPPSAAM